MVSSKKLLFLFKDRNLKTDPLIDLVSSTIVEIIGYGSLLFDCGEGTYGQMYRRFGHQGLERLISGDLKVIFISHLHADHHLGLVMILTARHRAQGASVVGEAITIVGPKLLELWLEEYSSCEPLGNYHFVDCEQFINSPEHAQEQTIPMNRWVAIDFICWNQPKLKFWHFPIFFQGPSLSFLSD